MPRGVVPILGRGIFVVNSRIEIALVRCPCAFRLRRLAQNVGTGVVPLVGPKSFCGKFARKKALVRSRSL